jgi:hypothetical protein
MRLREVEHLRSARQRQRNLPHFATGTVLAPVRKSLLHPRTGEYGVDQVA